MDNAAVDGGDFAIVEKSAHSILLVLDALGGVPRYLLL